MKGIFVAAVVLLAGCVDSAGTEVDSESVTGDVPHVSDAEDATPPEPEGGSVTGFIPSAGPAIDTIIEVEANGHAALRFEFRVRQATAPIWGPLHAYMMVTDPSDGTTHRASYAVFYGFSGSADTFVEAVVIEDPESGRWPVIVEMSRESAPTDIEVAWCTLPQASVSGMEATCP